MLWMAKLAIAKASSRGDTDRACFKVSVDRGNKLKESQALPGSPRPPGAAQGELSRGVFVGKLVWQR